MFNMWNIYTIFKTIHHFFPERMNIEKVKKNFLVIYTIKMNMLFTEEI